MYLPKCALLFLIVYINFGCSVDLKKKTEEEKKSLADILKLVNQNPGLEIRVEFVSLFPNFNVLKELLVKEDENNNDEKSSTSAGKKPVSKAHAESTDALLLAKELNETSTNILEKLNKTATKLDDILKRLNKIEKLFQEAPAKTKEQKHVLQEGINALNQTDDLIGERDSVAKLLLATV
jgi:hypothetical protein